MQIIGHFLEFHDLVDFMTTESVGLADELTIGSIELSNAHIESFIHLNPSRLHVLQKNTGISFSWFLLY